MFEDLIPELQPWAHWIVNVASASGLQPRVTSTRRTRSQQKRLFDRWRQGMSPYPAAPPGTSSHEFGYSLDVVVTPLEELTSLGQVWSSAGGLWDQSDPVHFQFPGFVPPAPQDIPEGGLAAFALDLGLGFVPVYGTITTVASLIDVFGVSHSEAVKMLASPTHYYNSIRNVLRAYGY